MLYALNSKNKRTEATKATKEEKYKCPCCGEEVVFKKGVVKIPHFSHKSKSNCDDWYEMSKWHKEWQENFPEEFREVVIEEFGEKHRADVKVEDLIIEFQHSNIAGSEFDKRNDFYSTSNKLVWLFDLRDKNIITYRKINNKTFNCEWKWAYKFNNLEHYGSDFDLFFQLDEKRIIKVVWNKQGFKYFGGYMYTKEGFKEYLRRKLRKMREERRYKVSKNFFCDLMEG